MSTSTEFPVPSNDAQIQFIVGLLNDLSIDQLANMGRIIKRVAQEKGYYLPWFLCHPEDFNTDGYEISEQKAEMAKHYAWQSVLADRKFTDANDNDYERINEVIANAVEAVSPDDFHAGFTRDEADDMELNAIFQLEPWVVYQVIEQRTFPEPHSHSHWGISSDGINVHWYESLEEIREEHFGTGRIIPLMQMTPEEFNSVLNEEVGA